MPRPPLTEATFDPVLCATCGGRCCQGHPGMWLDPKRFFAAFALPEVRTAAELAALLPAKLLLRELLGVAVPAPRNTGDGCVLHTTQGCQLDPDQRPCQCLALVPHIDTQMEGEIRCQLLPGHGSDVAHARWRHWWDANTSLRNK